MILPDWAWRMLGPSLVTGYRPVRVNPHSYDLLLGELLLLQRFRSIEYPNTPATLYPDGSLRFTDPWTGWEMFVPQAAFAPGDSVLAHTQETLHVPRWLRMQGMLKSSVAREGLNHRTALYIDAGFSGSVTLELEFARSGVLRALLPLIQVEAQTVLPWRPYDQVKSSHYMHQAHVTPNRAGNIAFRSLDEEGLRAANLRHLDPSRLPVLSTVAAPQEHTP